MNVATTRGARHEYSAGGVVEKDGKLLLVQVKNLKGELVWTFPKGHLEEGESPREAALREVLEETGYRCSILSTLTVVRYFFMREHQRVNKKVRWYHMRPEQKVSEPDAKEIHDLKWTAPEAARKVLKYPGDFRLLDLVAGEAAK